MFLDACKSLIQNHRERQSEHRSKPYVGWRVGKRPEVSGNSVTWGREDRDPGKSPVLVRGSWFYPGSVPIGPPSATPAAVAGGGDSRAALACRLRQRQ